MPDNELISYIHQLPKAELHIHLEGAIAPDTVLELARRHNKLDTLPADDETGLQKWFSFTDFDHFVSIYVTIQDLLRTPEDFALIAYRLGEDMAKQNIRYREATFTPYTHVDYQDKGLTIEEVLDGLEEGRQQAKAAFGVEIRWVFDIYRNLSFMINQDGSYHPEPAEKTLAYAIAGMDRGVVGYGIGGNEVGAPSSAFKESFEKAKRAGLICVPHAGETMGPESVWGAVLDLQADRIGHGVRAVEDPELLDYLKEHHITLEVNPTSNLRLHIYPEIESHPFKTLDDYGIPVTINSDDPPLFNTTLSKEYHLLADAFLYSREDLARFARNAFLAAGVEPEVKEKLLADFDRASADLL